MTPFPRLNRLEREILASAFAVGAGIFTVGMAVGALLWQQIKGR